MSKRTCLYCSAVLDRPRRKVCDGCRLHHRMVLYYKRNGRDINDRRCIDCGCDISDRAGNAKRCLECKRLEHNRDQRERKRRQSPPKFERECLQCGSVIGVDRRSDAKFCCRQCIDNYRSTNMDRTEYIRATQEHRSAYTREWRKNNPASTIVSRSRRRYREATGTISERDWQRLINRYGNCCAYCGERCEKVTLEHVVPLSRGGKNTIGNALPACQSCNSSKHTKLLAEWKYVKAVRAAA